MVQDLLVLDYEKTFRDRGSGLNYRIIWEDYSKTIAWIDKLKKFYLLLLFNYKY